MLDDVLYAYTMYLFCWILPLSPYLHKHQGLLVCILEFSGWQFRVILYITWCLAIELLTGHTETLVWVRMTMLTASRHMGKVPWVPRCHQTHQPYILLLKTNVFVYLPAICDNYDFSWFTEVMAGLHKTIEKMAYYEPFYETHFIKVPCTIKPYFLFTMSKWSSSSNLLCATAGLVVVRNQAITASNWNRHIACQLGPDST